MNEGFDDFTRAMGRNTSRRGVLKMLAGSIAAGAAVTILRPFRGDAAVCPPGGAPCGSGCCAKGESCSDPATACCCPKGTAPCGKSCCNKGVACLDSVNSICGCPKGTTPCGTGSNLRCCPAGTACSPTCPLASSFTTSVACGGSTTDTCPVLCGDGALCNPGSERCQMGPTNGGSGPCMCVDYYSPGALCVSAQPCSVDTDCHPGEYCVHTCGDCSPYNTQRYCYQLCPN